MASRPSPEAAPGALAGLTVAVTRPAAQAAPLSGRLQALGARVIPFPVLAIAPVADAPRALAGLGAGDLLVFVSANAVTHGLGWLPGGRPPPGVTVAAVGQATARALEEAGVGDVVVPGADWSGAGLLALPQFAAEAVAGRRVVVVRGAGGKEHLPRALRERGARVDCADVYRRECPAVDPAPVLAACARGQLDLVIVTSRHGLHNLFYLLGEGGAACLARVPVVVVNPEMVADLAARGAAPAVLAPRADDATLVATVLDWHGGRR